MVNQVYERAVNLYQPQQAQIVLPDNIGDVTILLAQPFIGEDDELGRELLRHVINTFSLCQVRERRLLLTHKAVQMACVSSYPFFLEAICGFLKRNGILMVCELSARKLDVLDEVKIGRTVGIDEICQCLISSQKVIRL